MKGGLEGGGGGVEGKRGGGEWWRWGVWEI